MSEEQLRDAILRGALLLQMFVNGKASEADGVIARLVKDLRSLINSASLSEATRSEVESLISQADAAIAPAYADAAAVVDTHALAIVVSERTVAAMNDILPAAIKTPSAERLASLTKDVLIDGAPTSAWWEKQASDTAFKFAAAVRQGVTNGETNEKIVARIVSRAGDGVLDIARRNARTLVHSSIMSAANQARLASFRNNADVIAGVRWLSTLDSHTCLQCAALDGQAWNLEGAALPGTRLDFQVPPAHPNCRCVLSPISKTFRELGIAMPEPEPGKRAAFGGQVSAKTTFADFLARQTPEFVDKVLGKTRADLFLAGRLTLTDLVARSGRELTLDELGLH